MPGRLDHLHPVGGRPATPRRARPHLNYGLDEGVGDGVGDAVAAEDASGLAAGDGDARGLAAALPEGAGDALAVGRTARTGGRSLTTSLKTGAALSKLSGMVPWALGELGW